MITRIGLGISLSALTIFATAAPSWGAISVFGGGLGQECYLAVEEERVTHTQALEICDLALETENLSRRDRAATLVNRGIVYMRSGRHERSLEDFERSLTLKPDLVEANVNVGAALYNLKRYPEALAALTKGLETENLSARAVGHYNIALILERNGDLQGAYEAFRTALDLKPGFDAATRQLERFTVETVSATS
jgi:tetratricopeptide (TPR) repeat protein